MGSKTVVMNAKTAEVAGDDLTLVKPRPLGIQSDTAFSEAAKAPQRPRSLLHRRPHRPGDGRDHGARPRRQEPP